MARKFSSRDFVNGLRDLNHDQPMSLRRQSMKTILSFLGMLPGTGQVIGMATTAAEVKTLVKAVINDVAENNMSAAYRRAEPLGALLL